jgi:hypothetical protein
MHLKIKVNNMIRYIIFKSYTLYISIDRVYIHTDEAKIELIKLEGDTQ